MECSTYFGICSAPSHSHIRYQIRSEFDNLLLRHAEESGAKVFEETKVTEIKFADTEGTELRPIGAVYVRQDGQTGEIGFDYLVDASARNGMMSTKVGKISRRVEEWHNTRP